MPAHSLTPTIHATTVIVAVRAIVRDPAHFVGEALAGNPQSTALGARRASPITSNMATSASVAAPKEMRASDCHERTA